MRTIILTYPGYQSLPKGIKRLLVATENFYFNEPTLPVTNRKLRDAKVMPLPSPTSFGNPFIVASGDVAAPC